MPLLVTTCTWPPAARPYSAWYAFVRILNSATASTFVVAMLWPLSPVSMLETPSIVMLFELGRWPFTVKSLIWSSSVLPRVCDSVPGTNVAKLKSARPLIAMPFSVSLSSVNPRSPLVVCSEVTRLVTRISSVSPPSSSANAPVESLSLAFTDVRPLQRLEALQSAWSV